MSGAAVETGSGIPKETRKKMNELRAEFARRVVEHAPRAWARLHLETRAVLLMVAGVDPAQDQELATLALKDWREFTPPERVAIAGAADALRWQLNGARDLSRV